MDEKLGLLLGVIAVIITALIFATGFIAIVVNEGPTHELMPTKHAMVVMTVGAVGLYYIFMKR